MNPSLLIEKASITAEVTAAFILERDRVPVLAFQRGLAGTEDIFVQLLAQETDPGEQLIEDGEDAWNESTDANVTSTADATQKKVGATSAKLAVGVGAAANAILATEAIGPFDLRRYRQIKCWVRSSVALNAGDIALLLDNTANCASPVLELALPAISANTWTHVQLSYDATTVGLAAIISVGARMVVDKGAFDLWFDEIRAEGAWNTILSGGNPVKLDVNNTTLRLEQPGYYRFRCIAAAGLTVAGLY